MTTLEELSRAIGCLDSNVATLFSNQEKLIKSVDVLSKSLQRKIIYDSAKIIVGAFSGGFAAMMLKLNIWG